MPRSSGVYQEHRRAVALLKGLYQTLSRFAGPPDCSQCCERSTPVVLYTEAAYIRDRLHLLPSGTKRQVIQRCRNWLLEQTGPATRGEFHLPSQDPLATQREVRWLRSQRCPFLNRDGSCLIGSLQPLECRVHPVPPGDRGPVYQVAERIMALVPQKTGFLPAQLMALLRIEEYTQQVVGRLAPDAKTAMGGGRALVAAEQKPR